MKIMYLITLWEILDDFVIVGIPRDQIKSNLENDDPFLKSCILTIG